MPASGVRCKISVGEWLFLTQQGRPSVQRVLNFTLLSQHYKRPLSPKVSWDRLQLTKDSKNKKNLRYRKRMDPLGLIRHQRIKMTRHRDQSRTDTYVKNQKTEPSTNKHTRQAGRVCLLSEKPGDRQWPTEISVGTWPAEWQLHWRTKIYFCQCFIRHFIWFFFQSFINCQQNGRLSVTDVRTFCKYRRNVLL